MKPLSILVVDDDIPTQQIIRQWLEGMGHKVECAGSGAEAAKRAESRLPELVITDILMPNGSGLELINRLQHLSKTVRILAISGGGPHVTSSSCLIRAHNSGAHALLLKPFQPDQLAEAIRYVMNAGSSGNGGGTPIRIERPHRSGAEVGATIRSREIQ